MDTNLTYPEIVTIERGATDDMHSAVRRYRRRVADGDVGDFNALHVAGRLLSEIRDRLSGDAWKCGLLMLPAFRRSLP